MASARQGIRTAVTVLLLWLLLYTAGLLAMGTAMLLAGPPDAVRVGYAAAAVLVLALARLRASPGVQLVIVMALLGAGWAVAVAAGYATPDTITSAAPVLAAASLAMALALTAAGKRWWSLSPAHDGVG